MISTPNAPDGLFHSIGQDPNSKYEKIVLSYEVGLDKIFDRQEIERKKLEPEFPREYECKYLGKVGNVFTSEQIEQCVNLGLEFTTDKIPVSQFTFKSVGLDPAFSSSSFGLVTLEHIKTDRDIIRVVDCHLIEKADPNQMVELSWEIWKKYGFMNTAYWIDASNRATVNALKMLGNLHAIISKNYLVIDPKYDKLLTSLRTAYARELILDKNQTSYDDLLDALRLSLKGYNFS